MKANILYDDNNRYNITLEYNNLLEAINLVDTIKEFIYIKDVNIYMNNNIITKINVDKYLLENFIEWLIKKFNASIMFDNYKYDLSLDINNYIDKLHTKATLNFGNYFSHENVYYISFDYANESDKDELLYYFNSELSNMMANLSMWPYIVSMKDKKKNIIVKVMLKGLIFLESYFHIL